MLVRQLRGEHTETIHPVAAVAIVGGEILWHSGPATTSPWRSSAKPFQLFASLEALGDPELDSVAVALGSSSHAGQPDHIARIRALLAHFDLDESMLLCGAEPPLHRPSWEELLQRGESYAALHNDCSGKHSFMIAACRARGWDANYRDPQHPLQQRIVGLVTELSGEGIGLATDGCSIPTLVLSVEAMARCWAHLAEAMVEAGDPWPDPKSPEHAADPATRRLARIGWAMARHPWWTSGDGRLDLDIATGARAPMVGKIGAGGIFCMAIPGMKMGLALKVLSGDEEALGCAVEAALNTLAPELWRRPDPWRWHEVRNVIGNIVGRRLVEGAVGVYPEAAR